LRFDAPKYARLDIMILLAVCFAPNRLPALQRIE
jgi:hypothetical protein